MQFPPATSLSQKEAWLAKLMVCPDLNLTSEKTAELWGGAVRSLICCLHLSTLCPILSSSIEWGPGHYPQPSSAHCLHVCWDGATVASPCPGFFPQDFSLKQHRKTCLDCGNSSIQNLRKATFQVNCFILINTSLPVLQLLNWQINSQCRISALFHTKFYWNKRVANV